MSVSLVDIERRTAPDNAGGWLNIRIGLNLKNPHMETFPGLSQQKKKERTSPFPRCQEHRRLRSEKLPKLRRVARRSARQDRAALCESVAYSPVRVGGTARGVSLQLLVLHPQK